MYKDKLPGGIADKRKPEDFDAEDLAEGCAHELKEHTKDKQIAREIAMDHLSEDPQYYKKLKQIEPEEIKKAEDVKIPSKKKMWMGKPISHEDHHGELELAAALNTHALKMPKGEAEAKAYKDYTDKQSKEAAGYHLAKIKEALAAGDKESAKKHGMLYNLHMKNLGLDPMSPPPDDVLHYSAKAANSEYKFKGHSNDVILGTALQPLEKSELFKGKLFDELAPYAGLVPQSTIHSQTPAQVMGFGNPMSQSGKHTIGQVKDISKRPRTDLSHRTLKPTRLNPAFATRTQYKKDKNQAVTEALAILGHSSSFAHPVDKRPQGAVVSSTPRGILPSAKASILPKASAKLPKEKAVKKPAAVKLPKVKAPKQAKAAAPKKEKVPAKKTPPSP
jgi:hypothetical protein